MRLIFDVTVGLILISLSKTLNGQEDTDVINYLITTCGDVNFFCLTYFLKSHFSKLLRYSCYKTTHLTPAQDYENYLICEKGLHFLLF